jgi:hypothetical protein
MRKSGLSDTVDLNMLGARPNGWWNRLRVGRRQNEHNAAGFAIQHLEQRIRWLAFQILGVVNAKDEAVCDLVGTPIAGSHGVRATEQPRMHGPVGGTSEYTLQMFGWSKVLDFRHESPACMFDMARTSSTVPFKLGIGGDGITTSVASIPFDGSL